MTSQTFGLVGGTTFRPGHRYEIHKIAYIALDQGGVGKGDLIRDVNINGKLVPKNTTCNCNQWPHQQSEPLFEWNNTNYAGSPVCLVGCASLVSVRTSGPRLFRSWN